MRKDGILAIYSTLLGPPKTDVNHLAKRWSQKSIPVFPPKLFTYILFAILNRADRYPTIYHLSWQIPFYLSFAHVLYVRYILFCKKRLLDWKQASPFVTSWVNLPLLNQLALIQCRGLATSFHSLERWCEWWQAVDKAAGSRGSSRPAPSGGYCARCLGKEGPVLPGSHSFSFFLRITLNLDHMWHLLTCSCLKYF